MYVGLGLAPCPHPSFMAKFLVGRRWCRKVESYFGIPKSGWYFSTLPPRLAKQKNKRPDSPDNSCSLLSLSSEGRVCIGRRHLTWKAMPGEELSCPRPLKSLTRSVPHMVQAGSVTPRSWFWAQHRPCPAQQTQGSAQACKVEHGSFSLLLRWSG